MRFSIIRATSVGALLLVSTTVFSHGLIQEPKSRNQLCGVEIKPDQASGTICEEAFASDHLGGYQFMSVLTHTQGRSVVKQLPERVCGFDSETWNGGPTPWDSAIDWPIVNISAGNRKFTWNISWGSHFEDTEEFRYWITKPDFHFQVGVPLRWSDFESEAFCKLDYDDTNPTGNLKIIPDKDNSLFHTYCDVPERSGRHVIYAEWGRNQWTYERFHGCVDVMFNSGAGSPPIVYDQSVTVKQNENLIVTLTGTDSDGFIEDYQIIQQPSHGTISGTNENRVYTPNVDYVGIDSFMFSATDNENLQSSPATITIEVKQIDTTNRAPNAKFLHKIDNKTIVVDAGTSNDPDGDTLTYAWTFGDNGPTLYGVNANHTYINPGLYDVQLTVSDGQLTDQASQTVNVGVNDSGSVICDYVISEEWDTGFVANIRLTNTGSTIINGWEVYWHYTDGSQVTHHWSSELLGNNSYTATNLDWNKKIAIGQTVEFGFLGTKGSPNIQKLKVSGDICR
ncbi:lytic polysaccharide monooxygenase [Microbulbifer sp. GL-2]|uniref:lytic polysaccharide monooxygenase n=1 Tax=Microbulbifer sp. GL-2 TaxID=2591606 RepID=UPI0011638F34|nr:lytic polysaccharide monooxygenase [Microbulbifer sp. GL-2]BBM04018.1 hypothetical protein GL2_40920 [Microbulbifer sp. GL-2]